MIEKDENRVETSAYHWLVVLAIGVFLSIVWYRNFEISQLNNSQTLTFMNMFKDRMLYPEAFLLKQMYPIHLYSPYYIIAGLIGLIFDPYWGLYGYFIFINCLCICAIFYLAFTVTRNHLASYLSVLALTLQWQWGHALGGSTALGICPFPDTLAMGILLFALAFYLQRRVVLAFLLTGFAFNIHGSFSLFVLFMMCLSLVMRKSWKDAFYGNLVFVVGALPLIIYIMFHPLPNGHPLPFSDWYHIVQLRSYGHTMPLSWGFGTIAKFIPYLMIFYIGYRIGVRKEGEQRSYIVKDCSLLALGILILCFVGIVFSEWIPIPPLIKLTLFRSTIFFVIFAVILYMNIVLRFMEKNAVTIILNLALIASMITASFPFMCLSLAFIYGMSLRARNKAIAYLAIFSLATIVIYALNYYELKKIWERGNVLLFGIVFIVLLVPFYFYKEACKNVIKFVTLLLIIACVTLSSHIYPAYSEQKYYTALKDLQLWLRDNTKKGEMLLYPPSSYIWSGLSERGDYFNYGQLAFMIYADYLGQEVVKRMQEYVPNILSYQNRDKLMETMNNAYNSWNESKFANIARKNDIKYIIVWSDKKLSFPQVFENSFFNVYKIHQ